MLTQVPPGVTAPALALSALLFLATSCQQEPTGAGPVSPGPLNLATGTEEEIFGYVINLVSGTTYRVYLEAVDSEACAFSTPMNDTPGDFVTCEPGGFPSQYVPSAWPNRWGWHNQLDTYNNPCQQAATAGQNLPRTETHGTEPGPEGHCAKVPGTYSVTLVGNAAGPKMRTIDHLAVVRGHQINGKNVEADALPPDATAGDFVDTVVWFEGSTTTHKVTGLSDIHVYDAVTKREFLPGESIPPGLRIAVDVRAQTSGKNLPASSAATLARVYWNAQGGRNGPHTEYYNPGLVMRTWAYPSPGTYHIAAEVAIPKKPGDTGIFDPNSFRAITVGPSDTDTNVASVTVTLDASTIQVGGQTTARAVARNAAGQTLSVPVSWTSTNTSVASVSGSGSAVSVSGLSSGTSSIRATAQNVTGNATITVTSDPLSNTTVASVTVTLDASAIQVGGQTTARAVARNSAGQTLNVPFSWTSTNTSVASVSGSGSAVSVSGLSGGTSSIRATAQTVMGSATINVATNTVPAQVTLSPTSASLSVGGTQTFQATVRNSSGVVLSGATVSWGTSNASVASIPSGTGTSKTVTAVAPGSATITATSGTASASVPVTVVSTPVTPPADSASAAGNTLPSSFTYGSAPTVTVTMKNDGSTGWTASGGYVLTLVRDGSVWLYEDVPLTGSVASGSTVTFTFQLRSDDPSASGSKDAYFSMARNGVTFGQLNGQVIQFW